MRRVHFAVCVAAMVGSSLLPSPTFGQQHSGPLLSPRLRQLRNITFDQISIQNGLPNATVMSICQDRRGFMWFATEGGLCRYDGHEIHVFEKREDDSTTISGTTITALCEDRAGVIWVGTMGGGLNAFDPLTGRFTRYASRAGDTASLSDPSSQSIYEDRAGYLWIGTRHGLNRLVRDARGGVTITRMNSTAESPISLAHDWFQVVRDDEAGGYWLGTTKGLYRSDPTMSRIDRIRLDGESRNAGSLDIIAAITRDKQGNLWVGTEHGGLIRLDPKTYTSKRYALDQRVRRIPGEGVYAISEDPTGFLWLGMHDAGLVAFDPKTEECVSFRNDPGNPRSLGNDAVWCIFQDDVQSLWVGTMGGGISRIDRNRKQFYQLSHESGNPNSLTTNNVSAVFEDSRGDVWIGTYGSGIDVLDKTHTHFKHFSRDNRNDRSLSHNYIWSFYEDRHGRIWIGTLQGLNRYEPSTQSFRHDFFRRGATKKGVEPEVDVIGEDSEGAYWVGSFPGLGRMTRQTERVELVSPLAVWSILDEGKDHVVWFGTENSRDGLLKFNTQTLQSTRFANKPEDSTTISDNMVVILLRDFEDPKNILWVGTINGLNRFDKRTGTFRRILQKDGLPNGVVNSLAFDRRGRLWIGTNRGLSMLDTRTFRFRNYDVQDGIQGNESGTYGLCLTSSGEMFYGGSGGVTIFYPDSIRDNPHIPPLVFTDFKITNKSVLPGAPGSPLVSTITEAKQITLSYHDNMISFEFAALDYTMPAKNRYAYKMEGFDKEWIGSGNAHVATYTNLDPGTYTLRVKGSNNDGVWNEQGISLFITITPPWWKTAWAYGAYVLLAGTILFGFYRIRMNRLRLAHQVELEHLEAEKIQEVSRLKSRFFANISHEFRTPLTLILGPADQIAAVTKDESIREETGVIKRNAQRLLHLVNQLLDLSRFEAGQMKIRLQHADLVEIVSGVAASFESMAARRNIRYTIGRPGGPIVGWFDPDAIEKILTNLLSNAFKYTNDGGTVALGLQVMPSGQGDQKSQHVEITVTDSGIGIPSNLLERIFDRFYQVDDSHTREHEGVGIGLALTKELVTLHKGSISVQSKLGWGSTFTVHLPLGKERLEADEIGGEESLRGTSAGGRTHPEAPPRVEPQATEVEPESEDDLTAEADLLQRLPIVLIVEDNADMRHYIGRHLGGSYTLDNAADGAEGLERAIATVPDLIISDVMMPKMDGFELCRKLKQDERTSHIPIVLLTAKAERGHKIEGLETGADDYLTKPFDVKELTIRVKNLIEQRRKLRERFRSTVVIKPSELAVTSADEKFLMKAIAAVEKHMAESNYDTEAMADELALSRMQLYRKLKALTGKSPHFFMRTLRLQRAADLLKKRTGNVSEVGYDVGFSNPSNFARAFKEEFGVTPSEYAGNGE